MFRARCQNFNPRSLRRIPKLLCSDFNPRSHKGSDFIPYGGSTTARSFQSTLPQGERPGSRFYIFIYSVNFNPRSHKGSDGTDRTGSRAISISIHAPTRGATSGGATYTLPSLISIHAPTRGATILVHHYHQILQ